VHNKTDLLGSIIKESREINGRTVESVANSLGISERYLYRIENEGKKPSYDVLYKLIRELTISPEKIFYPEKPSKDSEIENLLRLLSDCDQRALNVVIATVKALIENYNKLRLE
jgi:transcriptional regulator with XRE-family HTH domain